jgi:hypothetical protein
MCYIVVCEEAVRKVTASFYHEKGTTGIALLLCSPFDMSAQAMLAECFESFFNRVNHSILG